MTSKGKVVPSHYVCIAVMSLLVFVLNASTSQEGQVVGGVAQKADDVEMSKILREPDREKRFEGMTIL